MEIPERELVSWIEAYLDLLHQQRLYPVSSPNPSTATRIRFLYNMRGRFRGLVVVHCRDRARDRDGDVDGALDGRGRRRPR
eukprot:2235129-Rhodomonas_salina.1